MEEAVFSFPTGNPSIIKVIGVGGGGSNAVNHMYNEGIHDVSFVVCNTDNKALQDSPVPTKLQLGTEGLGAGNRPEKAKAATMESIEEVKRMLDDGSTKMVFVTAGMGGGTGTGAAPIIAKTAKNMDILTVGIVTIPFKWEGKKKIDQALDGVDEISQNVDALLVINNERLLDIYQDLTVINAFAKADDTLCNAARSIAEIITMHGIINLDFNDVKTVLKDGGVAIMSTGYGRGEGRVTSAIEDALNSPLLNNNDIYHSKKILLLISFSTTDDQQSLMMDEMKEVTSFMEKVKNEDVETKWGLCVDQSLGEQVKVTILATGFGLKSVNTEEMDNYLIMHPISKEEQEALDDNAERIAQRRDSYYGPEDNNKISQRSYQYFTFSDEDLDNDEVISSVEATPTYGRTRDKLKSLTTKKVDKVGISNAGSAQVISF
ncbi:MAG: cell division protein FtsZ [Bacteroidaceae bacterium]|nr:cell division protein FtsZ [Bacteroidaceae bacterium]